MSTDHAPFTPEPDEDEDQPRLVDPGPELLRHKLTLGTDEMLREKRLMRGDRIFLVVEARAIKDGRATDADGLYYTAGLDCESREIDQETYLRIRQDRLA